MASIKYNLNRKGELSAKIQVCSKDLVSGEKKFYYKRVNNEDNLTELKFKKKVERIAYLYENEVVDAFENRVETRRNKILSFEELSNEWIDNVKSNLSINYYNRAIDTQKRFNTFLKSLGMNDEPISEIRVRDLQMFFNSFTGYAPATVKGYKRILNTIFNEAVRYEWISKNPVGATKVGISNTSNLRAVPEKEVFSIKEAQAFISILNGFDDTRRNQRAFFKFMLLTGVRAGEMCGLKWSDIDFENKVVHIKRNRQYSKAVGAYEKEPKTKTSIRDIPLPNELIDELKDYYNWFKEYAPDFCENLDKYYLASNCERKPIFPKNLPEYLKKIEKRYGLKHVTCHGLRHTYCSILLSQNVPIQTVSKYMGHSDSTITLKVYSHFIPDTQQKAMNALSNVFGTHTTE